MNWIGLGLKEMLPTGLWIHQELYKGLATNNSIKAPFKSHPFKKGRELMILERELSSLNIHSFQLASTNLEHGLLQGWPTLQGIPLT